MRITEHFANDAGELMDGILADTDLNPIVFSFIGLDTDDGFDPPTDGYDDGTPTVERMKRCGMYHGEGFEL